MPQEPESARKLIRRIADEILASIWEVIGGLFGLIGFVLTISSDGKMAYVYLSTTGWLTIIGRLAYRNVCLRDKLRPRLEVEGMEADLDGREKNCMIVVHNRSGDRTAANVIVELADLEYPYASPHQPILPLRLEPDPEADSQQQLVKINPGHRRRFRLIVVTYIPDKQDFPIWVRVKSDQRPPGFIGDVYYGFKLDTPYRVTIRVMADGMAASEQGFRMRFSKAMSLHPRFVLERSD